MLIPHGVHILVIDGARMALFRNSGTDRAPRLDLLEEKASPAPRTSDLGTDQPGRGFQSMGAERGAYEQTDFHQQAEDKFVSEAAEKFNHLVASSRESAIVVAAPRALGVLRQKLSDATRQRLIAEIDKDYAGRSAIEICELLQRLEG